MGNGGFPPLQLNATDYTTIKAGDVVVSGTYEGCIRVSSTYYWVERGESTWILDSGVPDKTQVKITEAVWEKCCEAGTYTYEQSYGGWSYSGKDYKWNGEAGGSIELVEVEV